MPVLDKEILTDGSWTSLESSHVYECRIWLRPESEGGYSITSPSLPGMVTEAETANEASDKARETIQGLIAHYIESGDNIPWQKEVGEIPCGVIEKRILVNA